jgi:hypothetical protein
MDKKDYRVGYGKPPVASQFKPGNAGNPKGRPKGSRNVKTTLSELLSGSIAIAGDGKPRRISMMEAIAMKIAHASLHGDVRTGLKLLELMARIEADDEDRAVIPLADEDRAILDAHMRARGQSIGHQ